MDRFVTRSAGPYLQHASPKPRLGSQQEQWRPSKISDLQNSAKRRKIGSTVNKSEHDSKLSVRIPGQECEQTGLRREESNQDASDNSQDFEQHQVKGSGRIESIFEAGLTPSPEEGLEQNTGSRGTSGSTKEPGSSEAPEGSWINGQSSIYVDAFNLALETVLEDESHLFDAREMKVFNEWKQLGYEAQYLYVRLFLRKSAAWHRTNRLGYHGDVSDLDEAIRTLLFRRKLPPVVHENLGVEDDVPPKQQDIMLGESVSFADNSTDHIESMEEAANLLSLDELKALARELNVKGRTKGAILHSFCRVSSCQKDLLGVGMLRTSSGSSDESDAPASKKQSSTSIPKSDKSSPSSLYSRYFEKIMAITGPCIRLSPPVQKLFERVHLIFYRSTEWTEKSLTTIILAKISRRNFPDYVVDRSSNIFPDRTSLLEYEAAVKLEEHVDACLEGFTDDSRHHEVIRVYERIHSRWEQVVGEEEEKEKSYGFREGSYLRRFSAAHPYTRIVHKAAYAYGRLKRHLSEHVVLCSLLEQRLFHPSRRGGWYQRKALLEANYMHALHPEQPPDSGDDFEKRKKYWQWIAVRTCETGLQDRDTHLVYHYDLQKRLVKLEKMLKVPRREQHDFGHVRLSKGDEHTVYGVQIRTAYHEGEQRKASGNMEKRLRMQGTKTRWLDEAPDAKPGQTCSVEEMCLTHYRREGWKGYHAEGGIVRTLFAYLFFDILFMYVPNVFQTAYQSAPLDLLTDGFYTARAGEIERRLADISNGSGPDIVMQVWKGEMERHGDGEGGRKRGKTAVVGLNWDFEIEDVLELVRCFSGQALAAVCKVLSQEYRERGSGVPDLLLWRTGMGEGGREKEKGEVMFVEVKSQNDKLSDAQRLWIHVLMGAGVRVAKCSAIATEVRVLG